mgnify:CR=1 FL=1
MRITCISTVLFSGSYLQTLIYEKQQKRNINQGLLKSSLKFNEITVYDIKNNQVVSLPPTNKEHKISIYFFYLKQCIPSLAHLNYFSKYASLHRTQVLKKWILSFLASLLDIFSIIIYQSIARNLISNKWKYLLKNIKIFNALLILTLIQLIVWLNFVSSLSHISCLFRSRTDKYETHSRTTWAWRCTNVFHCQFCS